MEREWSFNEQYCFMEAASGLPACLPACNSARFVRRRRRSSSGLPTPPGGASGAEWQRRQRQASGLSGLASARPGKTGAAARL